MSVCTRHLVRALAATTALTLPALAQAQEYFPPAPPPIRETIDENGVDLTRGTLVSRSHSVSIGGPGNMGLSWSRAVTSGGGFRDSTAAFVSSSGSGATVSIGGHSESFTLSGGNYFSDQGTGATLSRSGDSFTYVTAAGTTYKFWIWLGDKRQYGGTHKVTSITYPTGERLGFSYEWVEGICIDKPGQPCFIETSAERLISVSSTNGYELIFKFALDYAYQPTDTKPWMSIVKVTARNMSVDPASQAWPQLAIAGTSFTDSLGRTTSYTYTSGNITAIKRPGAATNNVTITYSGGKASSVINDGVTTNYAYADASGVRTTTISDAAPGNRVVKTNLSTMLVTSDTNEAGKLTAYEYYPTGLLKKVTAPELNKAEFEYDPRGNLTKTTLSPKPGSPLAPVVTTATYPLNCATVPAVACNKPITSTDARGNVTNYAWDATTGQPTAITSPAPSAGAVRPETRYAYASNLYAQYRNSAGTLVSFGIPLTRLTSVSSCQTQASCAGTADEVKSAIDYGTANVLPTSVASGAGDGSLTATSAFTYDGVGNRLTVDGPLPGTDDTTRTRYDAARQIIGVVGPDPDGASSLRHRARRLTYNLDGQVTRTDSGTVNGQSDPDWAAFVSLEAVETGYDANARPVTQRLIAGGTTYALTQTSYDALGRLDCTATRMNSATFASPPASACTLATQGSAGPDRITKTSYDPVSRPIKATVALGTADQADEVTATYTSNGKIGTVKDGENNLTTYEYDGLDRVTKTRFPLPTQGANASSTTDYEQPSYDAASNVTSLRLRDGQSIGLTYDNLNRLTAKNLPGAEPDVTYGYDNLGRLTSASQTGHALTFTYDALSRNLTQAGPLGTVTSAWDLAGRRTRLTYPGTGLYVDYDYLVTDDMTRIRENGATSGVGVLATLAYDDLGRRTSLTRGNGTVTSYGFDPVSRLATLAENMAGTTDDQSATFTYNPASQIASVTKTNDLYAWTGHGSGTTASVANGLNQLTSIGGAATAHDARGNLTSDPVTGKSYTYSSENLLKTSTGGTAATLSYDPAMRLWELAAGTGATRFAYDGLAAIAQYGTDGTLWRRYVHGPGMDEPLVHYEGQGATVRRFLHADERGSIVAMSDDAGTVTAIDRYDEFGKPDLTNQGAFQYTGQMWLPQLGLYYYKARMYAPHLGRFTQVDPIGYADGMNLYAYVGNDPINLVDPLGLARWVCVGGEAYVDKAGQSWPAVWSCRWVDDPEPRSSVFDYTGLANFFLGPLEHTVSNVHAVAERTKCSVAVGVGAIVDVLGAAKSGVDIGLNAAHDVIFPPACAGPCVTPSQANYLLKSNPEFSRYFHKVYKAQQKIGGYGNTNDDLGPQAIMDAYDEWQQIKKASDERKKRKRKC